MLVRGRGDITGLELYVAQTVLYVAFHTILATHLSLSPGNERYSVQVGQQVNLASERSDLVKGSSIAALVVIHNQCTMMRLYHILNHTGDDLTPKQRELNQQRRHRKGS